MLDAVHDGHHDSVKLTLVTLSIGPEHSRLPILTPSLTNDPGHAATVTNMRCGKLDAPLYMPSFPIDLLTVGPGTLADGMHMVVPIMLAQHANVLPLVQTLS